MTGPGDGRLLTVEHLSVRFGTKQGVAQVVNDVSWELDAAETLAVVGESGSGKTVSVLALMGLVPQPPGQVSGTVRFGGLELVGASRSQLRAIRGKDIAMVFQDPMTSLNPVLTVGRQLTEHMEDHLGLSGPQARTRGLDLLERVGIPAPQRRFRAYPHQLSGGMRQRVVIAMALACGPKVLVADEATTALDVTTQAQIIELVTDLQADFGMGIVWISHDLGVVAGIADRVLVMYAGRVVEDGPVDALYARPSHPYTKGLLGSLPVLGAGTPRELAAIPGLPPEPTDLPAGCAFHPRCPYRHDPRCEREVPPLREVGPAHRIASFYDVAGESWRQPADEGEVAG